VNRNREIKRLAQKAVVEMIDELLKYMKPTGSICVQIAANEFPPDNIPVLHLANSEVIVDGTPHNSTIRYMTAADYFGQAIRDKISEAKKLAELRKQQDEDFAEVFLRTLKEESIEEATSFLEITGFSNEGIKRVLMTVVDKIKIPNGIEDEIENQIDSIVPEYSSPRPPPPQPQPIDQHEELRLRRNIDRIDGRIRLTTAVNELNATINRNVPTPDVNENDPQPTYDISMPGEYSNDPEVIACLTIGNYYNNVRIISRIDSYEKRQIIDIYSRENMPRNAIRSMIRIFNDIRKVGEKYINISNNHKKQAETLINHLYASDYVLGTYDYGRVILCGKLLGIYEPYIIDKLAHHNQNADNLQAIENESEEISNEDLEAAADVHDRIVISQQREQLYNEMAERREVEERGGNPLTTQESTINSEDISPSQNRQRAHEIIIQYLRNANLDIDYIEEIHRRDLLEMADFEHIPQEHMITAINQFNSEEELTTPEITSVLSENSITRDLHEIVRVPITDIPDRSGVDDPSDATLVRACRIIKDYYEDRDADNSNLISSYARMQINDMARQLEIQEDIMELVMNLFNEIKRIGTMDFTFSETNQRQAKALVEYMYEENIMIDTYDKEKVVLCGEMYGIYIPYIVRELAVHNKKAREEISQNVMSNIDDAVLRLFARITGTTDHDIDTMGAYVPQDMITQLYESADRNDIPRANMEWAILTYNQIHENESMNGYDEEQGRQSDVFINANYSNNEIINDTDRLVMIERARLLGIDTTIFELSIDSHNRVFEENINPQTTENSAQD